MHTRMSRAECGFACAEVRKHMQQQLHLFIHHMLCACTCIVCVYAERGFICAEVMKFEELKELGSESAVKAGGKYRQQGKVRKQSRDLSLVWGWAMLGAWFAARQGKVRSRHGLRTASGRAAVAVRAAAEAAQAGSESASGPTPRCCV
jgi:hypothetical protein